jgi:hypothetical protein
VAIHPAAERGGSPFSSVSKCGPTRCRRESSIHSSRELFQYRVKSDPILKYPSFSPCLPGAVIQNLMRFSWWSSCSLLSRTVFGDYISRKMPRAARKWTPEEDNLLSREVHAQCKQNSHQTGSHLLTGTSWSVIVAEGKVKDWTVIANKIPGRTNKDCRKRWHNVLSGGFNKGYWTAEEDKLLTRAVQTHGET